MGWLSGAGSSDIRVRGGAVQCPEGETGGVRGKRTQEFAVYQIVTLSGPTSAAAYEGLPAPFGAAADSHHSMRPIMAPPWLTNG
jgi:hypothetical protein